ncbi:toll/interleukin-1 receptor domain-containing protein [Massilia sp.]|uniref:toll/interleukin-1 receptor domain-containing protein n=1 Tax=Massilia sp. TaxID=1882437 RepID=UPI0028AE7BFD|nr:toll/interleukin-1 receptor domain-containing protein [Massilia sp.]
MSRAFLSHSSFDGDFVENVFSQLGPGKCVYDKETFKKNSDLALQINDGIEECDVYVLFLSEAAIKSDWVNSEIDLALELRTRWKIKKFLIFQLDDTNWSTLPTWMGRYLVSCPPSPHHVALRLLDELRPVSNEDESCYGRSEDERKIIDELTECKVPPSYLYFSGPVGIGRRTLANAVYKAYYPHLNKNKILIKVGFGDGILEIYRKALAYSANWRARDLKLETDRVASLNDNDRTKELARLLYEISTSFHQVVVIDLGTIALTEEGKPQSWFSKLARYLAPGVYPYILFLSNRFLNGTDLENGLFFGVEPLDDKWSIHLFRVLIKRHDIKLPSREEQDLIENSIVGHPGLITVVANYLRRNPRYKPNKTHNNIVKLINQEVQRILEDFIDGNIEREKAVAFISESHILSYEEIVLVSKGWPEFEDSTEALIDAGLLVNNGVDYTLASYIQRYASGLASLHRSALAEARKELLLAFDKITEETFVSVQLLDARIVEHIIDGAPISSYLSNLIMPSQQLKAAKRKYDAQDYETSLPLAKEAYQQSEKLSQDGKREAWRLIGLSAVRGGNEQSFDLFLREYNNIQKSPRTDAVYYFGNGFRERMRGNLREALKWFKKIQQDRYADSHVYRELAYIYAFERNFEEAYSCVKTAHNLALGNPYILDVFAMVLIERYRVERRHELIADIDDCLDELKRADDLERTSFYFSRSKMRDVIVNNDIASLNELFLNRKKLPISAKVALLSMLSLKGKDMQYREFHSELAKSIRDEKNPLAKIEIARVEFEHLVVKQQFADAEKILLEYGEKFTEMCSQDLARQLPQVRRTK